VAALAARLHQGQDVTASWGVRQTATAQAVSASPP